MVAEEKKELDRLVKALRKIIYPKERKEGESGQGTEETSQEETSKRS